MKKRLFAKKTLAMTMAALMAAGMLAGCSSGSKENHCRSGRRHRRSCG